LRTTLSFTPQDAPTTKRSNGNTVPSTENNHKSLQNDNHTIFKQNSIPRGRISNETLDWSNKTKYSGVTIDKTLRFTKHVQNTINQAYAAKNTLYSVINQHISTLPLKTKLHVYKTYIRTITTYAATAWASNVSDCSWSKFESSQSSILRQITGSPLVR